MKGIFLCILLMTSLAYAGPTDDIKSDDPVFLYSQGIAYEKEGKNKIALEFYIKSAERGYANAQLAAAIMYGNEENYEQRDKYMLMAATQENPVAQNLMGLIAFRRSGATGPSTNAAELVKAGEWFMKAAEQGHFPSQLYLMMTYASTGVKSLDLTEVCAWAYYVKPDKDYFDDNMRKIKNSGGMAYVEQMEKNGYFVLSMHNTDALAKHCDNNLGLAEMEKVDQRRQEIKTMLNGKRFMSLNNGSIFDF